MRVRLLVNLAGSSGALSGEAGDVRDVDEALARKFIDAGLVEPDDGAEAEGDAEPPKSRRKQS